MFVINIYLRNKINENLLRYFTTLDIRMKKLNDLKNFDKTLLLYDEYEKCHPSFISNKVLTQALKASTNLFDKTHGLTISKKISLSSMNDTYLLASLIHMFIQFNQIDEAEKIFQKSKIQSESMFLTIIKGYLKNEMYEKAFDLFVKLSNPNEILLIQIFNTCAKLENEKALICGRKFFDQMSMNCYNNIFLMNSAFNMFIKCKDSISAERIFSKIPRFLIGYGRLMKIFNLEKQPEKTIDLYEQMKRDGIKPDRIIYLSLINACARIGMKAICQRIVNEIPEEFLLNCQIQSSLIHMWGKSGSINEAKSLFENISQSDAIIYNSMINSYGLNGMIDQALELFHQMPKHFRDNYTFVCILNACSHTGRVDQARRIFNEISLKTQQIYTVMVDCLSRASLLEEAQQLIIKSESIHSPWLPMYMALLSSARHQRNQGLSEKIVQRMEKLFPESEKGLISALVLLSNVYAVTGQLDEAEKIRTNLIKSGKKKEIGLVWTEVNGKIWKFRAHDKSHPQSLQLYEELDRLSKELLENGHKFNSDSITRSISSHETIQSVLCGHSEKLAIAFHFIQPTRPSRIQITKNLRVCQDCHAATKLIARIRQCEIIVRDASRIHHFDINGNCSCKDYF
ncbi:hypothetical protein I4U23_027069 [Adineta vaga]|nr:hypothetical protein I4U23_027069 [Adineta vaga]